MRPRMVKLKFAPRVRGWREYDMANDFIQTLESIRIEAALNFQRLENDEITVEEANSLTKDINRRLKDVQAEIKALKRLDR